MFGGRGGAGGGFGGGFAPRKGADVRARLEIDLEEAIRGARKRDRLLRRPHPRRDHPQGRGRRPGAAAEGPGLARPRRTRRRADRAGASARTRCSAARATNLVMDLPVSVPDAVLGGKVEAADAGGAGHPDRAQGLQRRLDPAAEGPRPGRRAHRPARRPAGPGAGHPARPARPGAASASPRTGARSGPTPPQAATAACAWLVGRAMRRLAYSAPRSAGRRVIGESMPRSATSRRAHPRRDRLTLAARARGLAAGGAADGPPGRAARASPRRTPSAPTGAQQDEARRACARAATCRLGRVIEQIRRRTPGHQLDAGLETEAGGAVYRVRWVDRRTAGGSTTSSTRTTGAILEPTGEMDQVHAHSARRRRSPTCRAS